MDRSRREKWRRALESAREKLRSDGPKRIEPNRKDPTTVGVADEDEQALSEMLQTLASQQNRKTAEVLRQIRDALQKLAERPDEFGHCEACDEPIAEKRLAHMPWVALCVDCQAENDPKRGTSRRSLTD